MSMLNHFFNYKPDVLALDEKASTNTKATTILNTIW